MSISVILRSRSLDAVISVPAAPSKRGAQVAAVGGQPECTGRPPDRRGQEDVPAAGRWTMILPTHPVDAGPDTSSRTGALADAPPPPRASKTSPWVESFGGRPHGRSRRLGESPGNWSAAGVSPTSTRPTTGRAHGRDQGPRAGFRSRPSLVARFRREARAAAHLS